MSIQSNTLSQKEEIRFNELMSESYRKVYNMAFRLSGNRPDAEDLTQEAFYRAYRSFHEFEGDRPFENWIFRIVTRLFLDLLRSRKRRVKVVSYDTPISREGGDDNLFFDMPDHSPNPEEQFLNGDFSEELHQAINTLTAEQRLLITLADIEQIPYKEIAEMLDKPVGTIRSRLHRTHKALRQKLDQIRRESQPVAVKKRGFKLLSNSA